MTSCQESLHRRSQTRSLVNKNPPGSLEAFGFFQVLVDSAFSEQLWSLCITYEASEGEPCRSENRAAGLKLELVLVSEQGSE